MTDAAATVAGPRLSALIPTRNRPDLLADCLATLAAQTIAASLLEVVVVDDGSSPPLADVVAAAAAGSAVSIRCVRQEPSGLNAGRNRGIAETAAELIALLDDDTLVDPGWAAAMLAAFDDHGCDAVAGRIRLRLEGPEPRWLTPGLRLYLSELDLGGTTRWLEPPGSPFGANCAVRRAALVRAGGFRLGLDRIGASLVSNGDTEFFGRVRGAGGRILYCAEAAVEHRVPPERLTSAYFRRRARAQGTSDVLVAGDDSARGRGLLLAREGVRAGRALPIALRNLLGGRGVEPAAIWLAYCRGRVDAIRTGRESPRPGSDPPPHL